MSISTLKEGKAVRPYPCCNNPRNIKTFHPKPDVTIEVCQLCGRKHVTLKADPLQIKTA